jgi:hypothetical protein
MDFKLKILLKVVVLARIEVLCKNLYVLTEGKHKNICSQASWSSGAVSAPRNAPNLRDWSQQPRPLHSIKLMYR